MLFCRLVGFCCVLFGFVFYVCIVDWHLCFVDLGWLLIAALFTLTDVFCCWCFTVGLVGDA